MRAPLPLPSFAALPSWWWTMGNRSAGFEGSSCFWATNGQSVLATSGQSTAGDAVELLSSAIRDAVFGAAELAIFAGSNRRTFLRPGDWWPEIELNPGWSADARYVCLIELLYPRCRWYTPRSVSDGPAVARVGASIVALAMGVLPVEFSPVVVP